MTADEIAQLYEIRLQRAQQQPEQSRALPQYAYGDPAKHIRFKRVRGNSMQVKQERQQAEGMLQDWHTWSKSWRPALGAPRISNFRKEMALECEGADYDGADEAQHIAEMQAVEFCVDSLPMPHRQAIGIEMRNREGRARVWRSDSPVRYEDALHACMAVMRRRNLLR